MYRADAYIVARADAYIVARLQATHSLRDVDAAFVSLATCTAFLEVQARPSLAPPAPPWEKPALRRRALVCAAFALLLLPRFSCRFSPLGVCVPSPPLCVVGSLPRWVRWVWVVSWGCLRGWGPTVPRPTLVAERGSPPFAPADSHGGRRATW